jgi:hypothetical protein
MTHQVAYDALETVHWMLAEQARELDSETTVDGAGKTKKKTKAQRERDQVRFDTLCEVVSNVSGRTKSVEEIAAQARNGVT